MVPPVEEDEIELRAFALALSTPPVEMGELLERADAALGIVRCALTIRRKEVVRRALEIQVTKKLRGMRVGKPVAGASGRLKVDLALHVRKGGGVAWEAELASFDGAAWSSPVRSKAELKSLLVFLEIEARKLEAGLVPRNGLSQGVRRAS